MKAKHENKGKLEIIITVHTFIFCDLHFSNDNPRMIENIWSEIAGTLQTMHIYMRGAMFRPLFRHVGDFI